MSIASSLLRSRAREYDCKQVGRLLQRYLDDQLNESLRKKVSAHLMMCKDCGLEKETFELLKAALANHQVVLHPDAVDRLRAFSIDIVDHAEHDLA